MSAEPMNTTGSPGVGEAEHAGVLQEPAQDRAHADVLAQPRNPRAQRADPAHDHIDLHPGLGGAVERVDDGLVDHRVDLDDHAGGQPGLAVGDLRLDPVDQPRAQRARGHQQALERGARGVARELVEQPGEVLADLRRRTVSRPRSS